MEDNSYLINQLYRDIRYLNGEIRANSENLYRLRKTYQSISALQEEFIHNRRFIRQPEITHLAWNGRHASHFEELRGETEEEYMRIGTNEVGVLLDRIETKISHYENENSSLSNSISSKRDRIYQLSN
ncbi:DUF5082 family protein [Bacillus sp. P14.5]|uniref:YwqH-like family protein n=1 Tax=Bacillus sp. P14.5 TaxID=1983400 RepID=UPI000DE9A123|nr:DUF5082 family protein [Bacillus sp. P14.5]